VPTEEIKRKKRNESRRQNTRSGKVHIMKNLIYGAKKPLPII
jgi:hypothetical protein